MCQNHKEFISSCSKRGSIITKIPNQRAACHQLTDPLVHGVTLLSELDRMDVAPGTVQPKHLTVDQTNQILTHLTLRRSQQTSDTHASDAEKITTN